MPLTGKTILVMIPKNQFSGDELFGLLDALEPTGARTVVLSKSGQPATGMNRERFTPHGMIIDWNKQEGIVGKYHALVILGGKGAAKSLWDDPIVPQIVVDHHRAGSVIGAAGSGIVVLAKAGLLGQAATPDTPAVLQELNALKVACVEEDVVADDRILTASGAAAIQPFAQKLIELLK